MNNTPENIKKVSKFIFERPQIAVKILNQNGIQTSEKVTLNEIVSKTMTAIFNGNKKFMTEFENAMNGDGHENFASLVVGAGLSVMSSIFGARQAKKQRELQAKIAIAQMETEKLMAEEELRVFGEVERTRILANTLLQYRSNLQEQSTARQKNVYVYLLSIGCGIGIIYSSTVLIKAG